MKLASIACRAALALGFAAATMGAAMADGSASLDDILAKGVLRVGSTGDYKPFTFLDKSKNEFEGFDIDMARELAKSLGVKVEFVPTQWSNLMADFTAGKFDVAMGGISVTLERAKKAYFSLPYMREGKTPIVRCADKDKYQALSDIDKPGVRVIANPGGTNEKFDRANLKAAQITIFPDNTKIFEEVIAGHADVMITDSSETRYQQKTHPELCALHPEKPFDFAEKAYLLARDPALKAYVDQWLHLMMETGAYQKIFAGYFGQ